LVAVGRRVDGMVIVRPSRRRFAPPQDEGNCSRQSQKSLILRSA
jgi:hypothetical protein